MNRSFNPFALVGSYIGAFAAYYGTTQNIEVFNFLKPFLGFLEGSNVEVNVIGGFFVGYVLHVVIRSFFNSFKTANNMDKDGRIGK